MTIPTPERVSEGRGGWWVWFAVPAPDGRRQVRPVAPDTVRCKARGCTDQREVASWYCDTHRPPGRRRPQPKGGVTETPTRSPGRRGVGEVTPPATQPMGWTA